MKMSGNTILVTGGGSGIGRALAERFHAQGNTVIVAGRRRAALEEVVAGREGMAAIELDVTSADAIARGVTRLIGDHPDLNVLINNAGIMRFEDLANQQPDLADAEETITTNLLGPIRLGAALIPHLLGREDAVIVNVTSGLAFVPLVTTPTYSATKAALHSYTVSLREQLKGRIEVIELPPPAVQTDLTPGQSMREGYMPLDDFIGETMAAFARVPTPAEVKVERLAFLRDAEREGRFDQALAVINSH